MKPATKPEECLDRNCDECVEEDCQEAIAHARQQRDEAAGRYKTQMARKSRTARRISGMSDVPPRRAVGDP